MTIVSKFTEAVHLMFQRPVRCQFAALCYRRKKKDKGIEILVLTSRDTGRWVIPKGWPMGSKPGHAVAEQEAFEEAGVKGRVEHAPLGAYDYDKAMQEGLRLPCRVQVHALEVAEMRSDFKEKNLRKLEWVSCQEAAARVNEPQLKSLILAFEKRFAS